MMYKLFLIFALLLSVVGTAAATYESELVEDFINSPSFNEIEQIEDPLLRYCEYSYLDAYRRRDFSELELLFCKDFFIRKMEGELLYKKQVLGDRDIY